MRRFYFARLLSTTCIKRLNLHGEDIIRKDLEFQRTRDIYLFRKIRERIFVEIVLLEDFIFIFIFNVKVL